MHSLDHVNLETVGKDNVFDMHVICFDMHNQTNAFSVRKK